VCNTCTSLGRIPNPNFSYGAESISSSCFPGTINKRECKNKESGFENVLYKLINNLGEMANDEIVGKRSRIYKNTQRG
jgi:hypothetical protein